MICVRSRHGPPPVSSTRRRLLLAGGKPAQADTIGATNATRSVCLPTDRNYRPILNGNLGTASFYWQHWFGELPRH
jgi:hypothetical protein